MLTLMRIRRFFQDLTPRQIDLFQHLPTELEVDPLGSQ